MAVAYGTGTQFTHAYLGGVTSISTGNGTTSGGDANMVLVVGLCVDNQAVSGVTMVLDPGGAATSLTKIGGPYNNTSTVSIYLFGLSPLSAVSAKAVQASWTTSCHAMIFGAYFTGAAQTFGAAFINANSATASSNSPQVAITTANGNASVGMVCDNLAANCNSTGPTQIFTDNTFQDAGAAYAISTTSSDTLTASYGGSVNYIYAGVCVAAVGGGGGGSALKRNASLNGLSTSGPFFSDPLAFARRASGLLVPVPHPLQVGLGVR
jgi:hypothetical protein